MTTLKEKKNYTLVESKNATLVEMKNVILAKSTLVEKKNNVKVAEVKKTSLDGKKNTTQF